MHQGPRIKIVDSSRDLPGKMLLQGLQQGKQGIQYWLVQG